MTAEEVNRHVEWLQGEDDHIEEAYRLMEEERRPGR